VDVIDRDGGSAGPQRCHGGIAQPYRLLNESARGTVFAQQVGGFIVGVEDRAGGAAADLDPLAEGVVDGGFRGGAIGQRLQAAGAVVGRADGGVARRIAGRVVGVRTGQRTADAGDPVARGGDRVGGGGRGP
jgi:hypothetical protein